MAVSDIWEEGQTLDRMPDHTRDCGDNARQRCWSSQRVGARAQYAILKYTLQGVASALVVKCAPVSLPLVMV